MERRGHSNQFDRRGGVPGAARAASRGWLRLRGWDFAALCLAFVVPVPMTAAGPAPASHAPVAAPNDPPPRSASGPSPDRAPSIRIEVRGPAQEAERSRPWGALSGALDREIVDPCLGTRWRLIANAEHPERPGRLVLVDRGLDRVAPPGQNTPAARAPAWAIRSGDRLTVAQETAILRARFQAVALESAEAGQRLRVRLIGGADTRTGNFGTVVEVRAVAPGEAVWLGVEPTR